MSTLLETTVKDKFIDGLPVQKLAVDLRDKALAALPSLDFPTTKVEAWKYTRVGKITNKKWTVQPFDGEVDLSAFTIEDFNVDRWIFVNGFFRKDLSTFTNENIEVKPLYEAPSGVVGRNTNENSEIFTAINASYLTDGFYVNIPKNVKLEKPVHIIHLTTGENVLAQPRLVFNAEMGSEAHFIQSFKSVAGTISFTNAVTEIHVGENATFSMDKIQKEGDNACHVATEQVYQEASSAFNINTITLEGALVRNNLNIEVDAENCQTNLYGLYLLNGSQHVDNHTMVDHKKPHCESNELYKGIADDKSVAVFNGKVFVRRDAQKINAFQQNANILMTDFAKVNSKPELEIYADDVKCSHGSTTGQFDEEAVFYLRSRGIGEEAARNLLVYAFAADVLNNIALEPLRNWVTQLLEERFRV